MIGLREDRQERLRLVGKINALFPVWREAVVVSGASPLTTEIVFHRAKWAAGSAASKAAG